MGNLGVVPTRHAVSFVIIFAHTFAVTIPIKIIEVLTGFLNVTVLISGILSNDNVNPEPG